MDTLDDTVTTLDLNGNAIASDSGFRVFRFESFKNETHNRLLLNMIFSQSLPNDPRAIFLTLNGQDVVDQFSFKVLSKSKSLVEVLISRSDKYSGSKWSSPVYFEMLVV